ncbi:protein RAFTIN 1B-like [Gossypium arboreum]|uniref:protein RAFTIN 1B-like n=1 Tax=Gossypium arboreum TaxID=29729 RepID=UPI0022F15FCD|nr:protein RAFTIN 1B-like [Gossypium arboreum]
MGEHELVCHKMEYPTAMFLCHAINKTTVYKVPLVGRDGTKANALAVCHKETSGWNPKRMAFQILKLKPGTIVFLSSQGIVLEEAYWKSVFPNNPMPKALRDILPPSDSINGSIKDSNASYHAGSYRNEQSIQGNSTGPSKEFSAPSSLGAYQAGSYRNEQSIQDCSGNGTGSYEEFSAPSFLGAYQAGSYGNKQSIQDYSSNNTGLSKKFSAPSSLGVDQAGGYENEQSIQDYSGNNTGLFKEFSAPSSLSAYQTGSYGNEQSIQEASIDSNLNNNFKVDDNIVSVDETTFFFQRDLRTGKLVNLPNLIATGDKTPFLPDRVAKSIPFSSAKLPEILNHFSLKPQTRDANTIGETIRGCERAAINGEQKFCATSLESFIDLSISKLGKQIQLLSIEFSKETKNPLFSISRGMQNMGEHELVCHKMEYPGAVFLCHALNKTGVYKVPLVGRDGTKANALAVCHKDTSGWNPKHMAFQILKVKPGTVPICHFLFRDTLVWVSNSTAK